MNQEYDKEAYKTKKKAELDEIFRMLNDATEGLISDADKFKAYLDVQARLDRYSVSNAILVAKQLPSVRQLKTFYDWQKQNVMVRKGEKSIAVLEPYEYEKRNGESGRGYRVKKLFDVSQTNTPIRQDVTNRGIAERGLLAAIINDSVVPVEAVEGTKSGNPAQYDCMNKKVYVMRGLGACEFFRTAAVELAHACLAAGNCNYDRRSNEYKAEAAAYMICKRYGVDTAELKPALPGSFYSMLYKDVRKELGDIKNIMSEINERMSTFLEKQRESRNDAER